MKNVSLFTNAERAQVLTQALPYIQKYYGKTVVVKYGGNAMINEELKEQVMEDIVLLSLIGIIVLAVWWCHRFNHGSDRSDDEPHPERVSL